MCNLLFILPRINSKLLTLSYWRASLRTRKWASALGPTIQHIKNTPMIHLLTNTRVPLSLGSGVQWRHFVGDRGWAADHSSMARSSLPDFVNKALLEHSHVRSFTCCLKLLLLATCYKLYGSESQKYLALYRKICQPLAQPVTLSVYSCDHPHSVPKKHFSTSLDLCSQNKGYFLSKWYKGP